MNSLFNGSAGTLVQGTQSGTAYTLVFLRSAENKIVTYVVDTRYHSLLNPIQKQEQNVTTGELTTITTYAQRLY